LQIRDLRRFFCWQHLGDHSVNAQLVRDPASRGLVVSSQHDDLDVHGVQFAYCCCRRVAGSVRQRENPGRPSIDRHQAGNIAERSGDKSCYSGFVRVTRDSLS
jgi:hypothetical protein